MRCPHHDTPPLSIPSGILQKRSSHDQRIILRPRRLRCAAISSSSTPPFLFLLLVWIFCDCVTVFSREGKSTCCLLAISAFYIPSTSTRSACPKDGNSFVASGRQRHIQRYGLSHESRQQGTISLSLLSPNQQQQQQQQQPKMAAAHQYSSRKVASRKTQLRWITQTVQKIQARTSKGTDEMAANAQLVQALALLSNSRTQQQVLEAGRMLEAANISETQPVSIQERVVKAAAMTGLLRPALTLTEHMLLACKHLPAEICQDAVCNSLRRAGRIQRLERLLCQFGVVARTQNQQISLVAFNTYLAALCDVATGKDSAAQQQQKRGESGMVEGLEAFAQSRANYKAETLRQAWQWIQDPARTARDMAVLPDTVSYATVIQAAAIVGNLTLVDSIWKELKARNIQPNIVAYNARLRTVSVTSDGRERFQWDALGDIKKRDQEILAVWDNEIATDPYVSPDKYTIDLLLLPLIRAGRVGDVESLLDSFVKRNSETIVANAFTAFLLTVVGGGELATARALFETYILPTLSPVMVGDAGGMIRMVRPTTRHFNVLLEGYRKRMQNGHFDQSATDVANHAAADEGWGLYRLMIQSLGVRPDAYTITSMMGLCRTSVELSHLLFKAISDFGIDCSSVVLRAACKSIVVAFKLVIIERACFADGVALRYSNSIRRPWRRIKRSLVVF